MSLPERLEHLSLEMKHSLSALKLDLRFALTEPWTVLFGPSGSGKTTVLRAIAGLMRPDKGQISLRCRPETTEILLDTDTGVFLPAHRRAVRFSAQSPALFPQMTVRENIDYGARGRRVEATAASTVDDALDRFRLRPLAAKMPWELSGGERQRAAVVRAVTSAVSLGPGTLLLLDEPFAGLDLQMRDELLGELQAWLRLMGVPVLSVTHDVGEAFQLGAEVIKIADGTVMKQGPVSVALAEERRRLMEQLRAGSPMSEA